MENEHDDQPLSPDELRQLRRMLRDDQYVRMFRQQVKAWVITFGSIMAAVAALKALFGDLIIKHLK